MTKIMRRIKISSNNINDALRKVNQAAKRRTGLLSHCFSI